MTAFGLVLLAGFEDYDYYTVIFRFHQEDDDVIVESSEDDLNTSGSTEDGHIKALRAHKATLQQAVEKQQQQEQSRQQVSLLS